MDKTQEFIQKAILAHGNKYDYSKVIYTKAINKVIIICREHGEFKQTPNKHLQNRNCPKCSGKYAKSNTNEFINKAIKKYKNKYDYSNVHYINCDTKVKIICKKHGEFEQTSYAHLHYKHGCNLCAPNCKLTNDIFINKAKKRIIGGSQEVIPFILVKKSQLLRLYKLS